MQSSSASPLTSAQLRAQLQEAERMEQLAQNFQSTHIQHSAHDEPARSSLRTIMDWATSEDSSLLYMKTQVEEQTKTTGIIGRRHEVPLDDKDKITITKKEMLDFLAERDAANTKLISAVIEFATASKVDVKELEEHQEKKRKVSHGKKKRGCECVGGHCMLGKQAGQGCGCASSGVACTSSCQCKGESRNCENPHQAAAAPASSSSSASSGAGKSQFD